MVNISTNNNYFTLHSFSVDCSLLINFLEFLTEIIFLKKIMIKLV